MTRQSGEATVFAAAVAVAIVHALDDAFVHRGPGLGLGQHALAGLLAVAAGVAGIIAFRRLRPGLRAALAFSFGALALVNGVLHAMHVREHGAAGGDVTGLLAVMAGVVLLGLAVAIPWRRRGEGTWRSRSLAISGWYQSSENGAAVLVVHGGSSDRKGSVAHAELLARHGYGVLLYDARGRGESDGSENNYGWDWAKDVAGALDFLKARDDIDPDRIGALGLSTGADVLIEVAAGRDDLAGVVADGAAAGSFADWQDLRGTDLGAPPGWLMFKTIQVLSGDAPGPALRDAVARISSPTLLISAGESEERDFNLIYEEAARGPVEHWNLPDAHHTDAIRDRPREYEQTVVSFFDDTLQTRTDP